MHTINVMNVNQALHEGLYYLKTCGKVAYSRNGPVLVAPGPVATVYKRPQERVLFDGVRDANPVFHLIEALWMFAGRNDVDSLLPFNSNYTSYAEPDSKVHGAYGYRWRHQFGVDQLMGVVHMLRKDPTTRRAVISMWDPLEDLEADKRDLPCNTTIYFGIDEGLLNMTVCCRSNDAVWGAYGANVVHFSMLQELVARGAGVGMGKYIQFSNNFHIYTENDVVKRVLPLVNNAPWDPYTRVRPTSMFNGEETVEDFLEDCDNFFKPDARNLQVWHTMFFAAVAAPLRRMYLQRKEGTLVPGQLEAVSALTDWHQAFQEWAGRRVAK